MPNETDAEVQRIMLALAEPFHPDEVKFKPAVVSGNRALALAYVDARVIQDRLDDVLGVAGWQDEYEFLPDGSVICRLRLRLGGEWITKMDVGGQSEQPDEGDRHKAAVSDALKRAAVKFGVGRYLYRLPQVWADYDPQKRQFVRKPTLPVAAGPGGATPQAAPRETPADKTAAEKAGEKPAQKTQQNQADQQPTPLERIRERINKDGVEAVRKAALNKAAQFGVRAQEALAAVEALGEGDLDAERLLRLGQLLAAVERGEKTREQAFPGPAAAGGAGRRGKPYPATQGQQADLQKLARQLGWSEGDVLERLAPYKARFWAELDRDQAAELLRELIAEAAADETARV